VHWLAEWTELPTPHPVIEPVSSPKLGTGILDAEAEGRNGLIRPILAPEIARTEKFRRHVVEIAGYQATASPDRFRNEGS
jgi:hypothetical protein